MVWISSLKVFPEAAVQRRSCQKFSENMQQIYNRTPMLKRDFKLLCNVIEITFQHGCSPVNLLHISRTPFPWNTSGWPLLFSSSCLLNSISTSGCLMISATWSINFQMVFLFYMSLSLPCLFSICQLRKLLAEPWVLASVV